MKLLPALVLFLPAVLLAASIAATIPAPDGCIRGLGWNNGSLWGVDHLSGNVYEIDPETGTVLFSFHPDLATSYPPHGLACGNDTVYVSFVKQSTGAGVQGMYDCSNGNYLGNVYFC